MNQEHPPTDSGGVRRAADEALFWASILEVVRLLHEMARHEAIREMNAIGSEKQRVRNANDEDLGTLTISSRRWVATITDPAALAAWVRRNRPDEMVPVIRDSYLAALRTQAETNAKETDGAQPWPIDKATGAVVPGVEAQLLPGTLTVRKTRGARARARELLGELLGRAIPELASSDRIQAAQRAIGDGDPE